MRWIALTTPFNASQATVEFVSRTTGFAIEDYPHADHIWTTADGGARWRLIIARRA